MWRANNAQCLPTIALAAASLGASVTRPKSQAFREMNSAVHSSFDLSAHGLTVTEVHHNLPPSALYEHAIRFEKDASIAENGALVAYSGVKTGRSPKDKRVVENPASKKRHLVGAGEHPVRRAHLSNQPPARARLSEHARAALLLRRLRRLGPEVSHQGPRHLLAAVSRALHAHDAHPPDARGTRELRRARFRHLSTRAHFPRTGSRPAWARPRASTSASRTSELVILGTEYAGEMKKGVFTVANYFAPKRGVLSMHCSATADKETGASSLLFGLSGTGKTTLSADPKRHLIGDDEHCWSDDGIFNIEGGCYAKAINLTPESEPDIFQALRFGAVLENVVLDEDRDVDYTDTSITQNTRGAYPIEFIHNAKIPVHRRPSDRRDLPHLRRLRRAAAGQRALAGARDVSLHQRLHGEGRRHRNGRDRAAGDVLALLRRAVPRLASEQIRRAAGGEDAQAQRARLAREHRLGRRRSRRRQAHQSEKHARHHRRDPRRLARESEDANAIRCSASMSSPSARTCRRRFSSRAMRGRTKPPTMPPRKNSPGSSTRTSRPMPPARAPR